MSSSFRARELGCWSLGFFDFLMSSCRRERKFRNCLGRFSKKASISPPSALIWKKSSGLLASGLVRSAPEPGGFMKKRSKSFENS